MILPVLIVVAIVLVLLVVAQRLRGGGQLGTTAIILAVIALGAATTFALISAAGGDPPTASPQRSAAASDGGLVSTGPSTPPIPSASGAVPSGDLVLLRYEVALAPGTYRVFRVDAGGEVVQERQASFDARSRAPVDRVEAGNGLVHWRIPLGGFAGWSFVSGTSGEFTVREVLRAPDGSLTYRAVAPDG